MVTMDEEEWVSIKEAADFLGRKTQNIHYHFKEGNLTDDRAASIASGRDPSLRVRKTELLTLKKRLEGRSGAQRNQKSKGLPLDMEVRIDRIEQMLAQLLGARDDAAQVLKVRVDQQADALAEQREATARAERARDAVLARLLEVASEAATLSTNAAENDATLQAYADALTQLLSPSTPPQG